MAEAKETTKKTQKKDEVENETESNTSATPASFESVNITEQLGITESEIKSFKDYEDHFIVITTSGQKIRGEK